MIDILFLYKLIKPESDPDSLTQYPLIIGGTDTNANLENGLWVLNLISSSILSMGEKFVEIEGDDMFQVQRKKIRTAYQLDFYKSFDNAIDLNQVVQVEAMRMREWLGSYSLASFLRENDAEISPVINPIAFTTSLSENKQTLNRARLEFDIFSFEGIRVKIKEVKEICLRSKNAEVFRN